MASFSLKAKFTRSSKRISTLPERMARAVHKAFKEIGMTFIRRMKVERLAGRPGLKKRTGEFAKSFQMELEGNTLQDLSLRVFTKAKQANLQEYGGTVVPTTSQYLAIPLPAAMTAAGVARGGPRDFKDTFFAVSKAGNLILFQKLGKSEKTGKRKTKSYVNTAGVKVKSSIVPLFVMKKSVTIPPRLGMRALWQDMKEERREFLRTALAPILRKK